MGARGLQRTAGRGRSCGRRGETGPPVTAATRTRRQSGMPENAQRVIGGVLGFALAVVWIVAGAGDAAICLVAASFGFGLAVAHQRIDWRTIIGGISSTRTRIEASAATRTQ